MALKYIELQVDADPENRWVKDYINIGLFWESVADRYSVPISGLITPYQLNAKMDLLFDGNHSICFEVDKQLENVRGTGMEIWPILPRTKVHLGSMVPKAKELKILRSNIYNWIYGFLMGFKMSLDQSDLLLFKDSFLVKEMNLNRVKALKKFLEFKVGPKNSILHLGYIPDSLEDVERLIQICVDLKKRCASIT